MRNSARAGRVSDPAACASFGCGAPASRRLCAPDLPPAPNGWNKFISTIAAHPKPPRTTALRSLRPDRWFEHCQLPAGYFQNTVF